MEAFLIQLVLSLVITAASYGVGRLLAEKPEKPKLPSLPVAQAPDPLNDYQATGGPLVGLLGHRRISGKSMIQVRVNNATYVVYMIAGAPVTSIDAVYIDNALVAIDSSGNVTSEPWGSPLTPAYSMQVWLYDGSQTSADPTLMAALPGWTADYIGERIVYAVVKIDPSADSAAFANTYSGGIPDFTFHVRGFGCYDPRDESCVLGDESTYIFSQNASIIEANYLIHELGMRLPTDRIDWDSVEAAADIDDESVDLLSGGVEPRYSAALYWLTDETHEAVLARIGAAHAGGCRPVGRNWVMLTGTFPASSATILPDTYADEGLTVTEKTPLSGRVNGVRGKFVSPTDNYEMRDFPNYQSADDLAADNSREEWLELDLGAVVSHTQAQRLARIAYLKARNGYAATLSTNMTHFDVVADDVVTITDEMAGLSSTTFRVQSEMLTDGNTIDFMLSHETAAMFAWDETTDEQEYVSSEPVAGETGNISPPCGLLYDSTVGGSIIPNVLIWPSPSTIANADHYQLLDNSGTDRGATPLSASVTTNAVAYGGASSIAGSWRLQVRDIDENVITESSIVASGTAGTLSDDPTLSTYYTLPAPREPVLVSFSSGAAQIKIRDVTSVIKASHVRLYRAPSSDMISVLDGTFEAQQVASGSGNTFSVTGTPNTAEFFFAVLFNSTDSYFGYPSKPIFIVF